MKALFLIACFLTAPERPPLERVQGKSADELCWMNHERGMLADDLRDVDLTAAVIFPVYGDTPDYEQGGWPGLWLFCYRRVENPGWHGRRGDECKLGFNGREPYLLQLTTRE